MLIKKPDNREKTWGGSRSGHVGVCRVGIGRSSAVLLLESMAKEIAAVLEFPRFLLWRRRKFCTFPFEFCYLPHVSSDESKVRMISYCH